MPKKISTPPKLVYFPSTLTASGWRVYKWSADYDPTPLTPVTKGDESYLPVKAYELSPEEEKLSLDELIAKYPAPSHNPTTRDKAKPSTVLARGKLDVTT